MSKFIKNYFWSKINHCATYDSFLKFFYLPEKKIFKMVGPNRLWFSRKFWDVPWAIIILLVAFDNFKMFQNKKLQIEKFSIIEIWYIESYTYGVCVWVLFVCICMCVCVMVMSLIPQIKLKWENEIQESIKGLAKRIFFIQNYILKKVNILYVMFF